MEQIFIDRFIVPAAAQTEFQARMATNRNMIKQLPGFIQDDAYGRHDEEGNLLCVTIAVWASETNLQNAKALVQAEYQKQGFDLPAMLKRLDIKMERGQYHQLPDKGLEG